MVEQCSAPATQCTDMLYDRVASPQQDRRLLALVAQHGTVWKAVANKCNSTPELCKARWQSLTQAPSRAFCQPFSRHERMIAQMVYQQAGPQWALIASHLPGRSSKDVQQWYTTRNQMVQQQMPALHEMQRHNSPQTTTCQAESSQQRQSTDVLECPKGQRIDQDAQLPAAEVLDSNLDADEHAASCASPTTNHQQGKAGWPTATEVCAAVVQAAPSTSPPSADSDHQPGRPITAAPAAVVPAHCQVAHQDAADDPSAVACNTAVAPADCESPMKSQTHGKATVPATRCSAPSEQAEAEAEEDAVRVLMALQALSDSQVNALQQAALAGLGKLCTPAVPGSRTQLRKRETGVPVCHTKSIRAAKQAELQGSVAITGKKRVAGSLVIPVTAAPAPAAVMSDSLHQLGSHRTAEAAAGSVYSRHPTMYGLTSSRSQSRAELVQCALAAARDIRMKYSTGQQPKAQANPPSVAPAAAPGVRASRGAAHVTWCSTAVAIGGHDRSADTVALPPGYTATAWKTPLLRTASQPSRGPTVGPLQQLSVPSLCNEPALYMPAAIAPHGNSQQWRQSATAAWCTSPQLAPQLQRQVSTGVGHGVEGVETLAVDCVAGEASRATKKQRSDLNSISGRETPDLPNLRQSGHVPQSEQQIANELATLATLVTLRNAVPLLLRLVMELAVRGGHRRDMLDFLEGQLKSAEPHVIQLVAHMTTLSEQEVARLVQLLVNSTGQEQDATATAGMRPDGSRAKSVEGENAQDGMVPAEQPTSKWGLHQDG